MRKQFMLAALLMSFVLCNTVAAANYSISDPTIVTVTPPDNIPRTAIWFVIQDLAEYNFPPIHSVVRSFTISDQNGQSRTLPYIETPPYDMNGKNYLRQEEIVRLDPYYITEFRGIDRNKNGIIEPYLGEYEKRVFSDWEYCVVTRNFPLSGGTYNLLVDAGTQTIKRTISGVQKRELMPPITDINAKFDNNGKFNISWGIPDVYLNNYETYKNATVQIRVDRYTKDGNKAYWRARVDSLPLFINGIKFDNYSFFKYESDILRLYTPYIKVQIRIDMPNNRSQSDWREFKIDGYTATPTAIPIPITQTQLDQLINDNLTKAYDIQQGGAGLTEIQTLLNTPQGQRKASNSYLGQLGERINTIIRMLLPPGKAK